MLTQEHICFCHCFRLGPIQQQEFFKIIYGKHLCYAWLETQIVLLIPERWRDKEAPETREGWEEHKGMKAVGEEAEMKAAGTPATLK